MSMRFSTNPKPITSSELVKLAAENINPDVARYAQEPTVDSGVPLINNTLNPIIVKSFAPVPGTSANPLYILEIFKPQIYLFSNIDGEQLGYVLAHGQAHLK